MSIEFLPNQEVMENPEAFFIATNNKRYLGKALSGAGIVGNGIAGFSTVSSALEAAYITTKVARVSWLPCLTWGLFGKTVTKFSLSAFLGGLNPILFIPLVIGECFCITKVFSKQKSIKDADMVIHTGMFDFLGKCIFCHAIYLVTNHGKEINWENLYEVMKGFGYKDFYINSFIQKYKKASIEEIKKDYSDIRTVMYSDKNYSRAVKKYACDKVVYDVYGQIY